MQIEDNSIQDQITKLEKELKDNTSSKTFDQQLFEYYPDFIQEDYQKKNIILINGINYKNLSNTEIAYFLTKNPNLIEKPVKIKESNKRPKYPMKSNKNSFAEKINVQKEDLKKERIQQERNQPNQITESKKDEFCICRQK